MNTTTRPVIFGATTEGSPNEICRITTSGAVEVFRHEESDVAQLARTAGLLMKERDEARAYTQTVVEDITEEMNGLKAGNARLLRELEELRKDKARLDWLAEREKVSWGNMTGFVAVRDLAGLRERLDAAMEASK